MNENILSLKGSPSRDEFKSLHKTKLGNGFYACDIDLVLVDFRSKNGIVCILDCKRMNELITNTEHKTYQDLGRYHKLFIIRIVEKVEDGHFIINEYRNGEEFFMTRTLNWEQFKQWETELRQMSRTT
jgi:hypothetical protein